MNALFYYTYVFNITSFLFVIFGLPSSRSLNKLKRNSIFKSQSVDENNEKNENNGENENELNILLDNEYTPFSPSVRRKTNSSDEVKRRSNSVHNLHGDSNHSTEDLISNNNDNNNTKSNNVNNIILEEGNFDTILDTDSKISPNLSRTFQQYYDELYAFLFNNSCRCGCIILYIFMYKSIYININTFICFYSTDMFICICIIILAVL